MSDDASDDPADDAGYFYGFGIGMGFFSSIFASAGLFLLIQSWKQFCSQQEWTPQLLISTAFQSLFSLPFIGVPMFMYLGTRIWLTPVIGYSLPFMFAMCLFFGRNGRCNCRNPLHQNQRNNNNDAIQIHQHQPPKNMMIYNWLKDIELTEYYHLFINEGYATVQDIETINAQDLEKLNITKHFHVKKILDKINNNNGQNVVGETMKSGYDREGPPSYNQINNLYFKPNTQ